MKKIIIALIIILIIIGGYLILKPSKEAPGTTSGEATPTPTPTTTAEDNSLSSKIDAITIEAETSEFDDSVALSESEIIDAP